MKLMRSTCLAGLPILVFCAVNAAAAQAPSNSGAQRLAWSFQTGGPIYGSPTVHEGTIYIGSGDGHLYAVDDATGAERWRFAMGGAVDATPTVADGTVYALSRAGVLHAVNAGDGSPRWEFRTAGEERLDFWDFYLSDPLVHEGMVVFGSGDGNVYALDRETGAELWRFATGGIVHAAPVADDRHVYVGGFDGALYALSLDSGEPAWTFQAEGNPHFPLGELQRGPALHDGVLYVGSRDYHLYAVDAADGKLLWKLEESGGWIIATPLVEEHSIYFGASDGERFYAADRADGMVRWAIPVQTRVFGSAVRVQDLLVFGGFNGKLFAVDADDGQVRWTFQTPASRANFSSVYDASGAINEEMREMYRNGQARAAEERILMLGSIAGTPAVHGSRIYFGSTEGLLYVLEVRPEAPN